MNSDDRAKIRYADVILMWYQNQWWMMWGREFLERLVANGITNDTRFEYFYCKTEEAANLLADTVDELRGT